MQQKILETDVLCVGGGIAGLMAAIRAAERGAKVVVAEKGNALRSGAGATGNDHFMCYMPEVHGADKSAFIKEMLATQLGIMQGRMDLVPPWLEKTLDIVRLWEDWGIPMKYQGRYEFAGHAFPGDKMTHLKYSGENQKPVLTRQALKRGVTIMNRVMIVDLAVHDGRVVGAIGLSTREETLLRFRAKSVVLATGRTVRLFPGVTPGWMCNLSRPPSLTGDGRAVAYRAGAELFDVEKVRRHVGPKYFSRCGQATWIGVYRDAESKPLGPFVRTPDRQYGDVTPEVSKSFFEEHFRSGKGPVYMDCAGISEGDYDYMKYWLAQEGNRALLAYLEEKSIDPRTTPVEFMTYEPQFAGGIHFNARCETSLQGLYAAGDEYSGGISGAATFGWFAGENAAEYARSPGVSSADGGDEKVREWGIFLEEVKRRSNGPDWRETNLALQQIMGDYAWPIRSEASLDAGLQHIRRLREEARATITARAPHELARCAEVLNLLDLGELVFVTGKERKETRGMHKRADYPLLDPRLSSKALFVKNIDGIPSMEWR